MPAQSRTLAHDLAHLVIATIETRERLPWTSDPNTALCAPTNPVRRDTEGQPRPYRGINFIVLLAHARAREFETACYATRQQWWDETRAPVKAAALPHPAPVVYFLKTPRGSIARLSAPVYNIDQTAQHAKAPRDPFRSAAPLPGLQLMAHAEAQFAKTERAGFEARFESGSDTAQHLVIDIASAMTAVALRQPHPMQPHHHELIDPSIQLLRAEPAALLIIAAAAQRIADAIGPTLIEASWRQSMLRILPNPTKPSLT